jgi:hypothetical protein
MGTPEPVAMAVTEESQEAERGRIMGQALFTLVLLGAVFFGVYLLAKRRPRETV